MDKKEKVWTVEEILGLVKKPEEFSIQPVMGYAAITDSDNRWKRLFRKVGEDQYIEVDLKGMVEIISEYLSKHISLEKLLADKLLHKPLETILSLEQRVKAKGEVKEHKGCYYLLVKGKRGPSLEVNL